jgi:hypothetical protein
MSVSLWCLCWKHRWVDGRLKGLKATAVARRLSWTGDPAKLIEAMIKARVLDVEPDGTYIAHNFEMRQKGGIGIFKRNQARKPAGDTHKDTPGPGSAGDDSVVKLCLDRMRQSKTPGTAKQHRGMIEAWRARGLKGGDIEAAVMNNPGKNVFELEKLLVGKNGAPPPNEAPLPSLDEIRKKFGRSK